MGMGTTGMSLRDQLNECNEQLLKVLDPVDRKALEDTIERLRMLQLVEQGLAVGDLLPEFALPDGNALIVTSEELLARGPLALAFFRGPWCPYCSLALQALEEARPRIEDLGASLVAVAPMPADELRQLAAERGLGLRLLSDATADYARVCGVQFEMTEGGTALYGRLAARFGLEIPNLDAASGWELPIPATYVAGRDGVIRYAFGDADWSKRAEPEDIVGVVESLAQAAGVVA
jgi:peroxiredoxin